MAKETLKVTIVGDATKATSTVVELEKRIGTFGERVSEGFAKIGQTAAGFALGGGITQLPGKLLDMAKGAADDAASVGRLQKAVENADGSWESYAAQIDAAIAAGQKKAFSDDQTRGALSLLIAETGSTEEAMKRLSAAQDLARGTGMDVVTAAKLLGRVTDENTSVLSRYGITVEKGASAQDLLNAVDAKFKGQAATFAESDAGKMAIAADKAGELQEQIGAFLIPVLSAATTAGIAIADVMANRIIPAFAGVVQTAQPLVTFIGDNLTPILLGLAPILGGVAVAVVGSMVPAIVAWTVATWASVAAHVAAAAAWLVAYAPIILILAAVGVAAAALYVAWDKNLFGIRDITDQVWGWIKENVPPIIADVRHAIDVALSAISAAWDATWPVLQSVVEAVLPVIKTVVETYIKGARLQIELALAAIEAVWNAVFPVLRTVVETVFPIVKTIVTENIAAVQKAIELAVDGVKIAWRWWETAHEAVEKALRAITGVFANPLEILKGIGEDIIRGLANGITAAKRLVEEAAQRVVDALPGIVKKALGISSPSKVMFALGVESGTGFALGLESTVDIVKAAAEKLATAAVLGTSGTYVTGGIAGGGGSVPSGLTAPAGFSYSRSGDAIFMNSDPAFQGSSEVMGTPSTNRSGYNMSTEGTGGVSRYTDPISSRNRGGVQIFIDGMAIREPLARSYDRDARYRLFAPGG